MKNIVRVSAVQAAPELFNLQGSISKFSEWLNKSSEDKPDIVLFPEAFIPAYPRGFSFGSPVGSRSVEGRELWKVYYDNSIDLQGKEMQQLSKIVKTNNVFTSLGVIERENGTLYCSMIYFNKNGDFIGKHRKLKPTAAERVVWGEGDGRTLETFDTENGKIGGLICWENYMPLARMAMYSKGVQIYLAPTADHRDSWQATMRHIACEGRCFVIGCNQFVTKEMYPNDLPLIDEIKELPETMSNGGSVIVSPFGDVIAGPLFGEEGIVSAELDMDLVTKAKMDFDPSGHYNRPDVFKFSIPDQPEIKQIDE